MAEEEVNQENNASEAPEATKSAEEVFYGDNKDSQEVTGSAEETQQTQTDETTEQKQEEKPEEVKETKSDVLEKKEEAKEEKVEELTLNLPKDALIAESELENVKTFAKSRSLNQEDAQGILEWGNSLVQSYHSQFQPGGKIWDQMESDFKKVSSENKEIGGNQNNLVETAKLAKQGLETVMDGNEGQELFKLIESTPYGSHHLVLKFLRRVGELSRSDTFEKGTAAQVKKPKSIEEIFYGNKEAQSSA